MTEAKAKIVVVGVDFQRCGDEAILAALRMLNEGSASEVHMLHVLDPRDVIDDPQMPLLQTEEEVLERGPGILRSRVEQLASVHGLLFNHERVVSHVRVGRAVETLLQMTVDYDADLLVISTHSRHGIDRLVLGSVAEALVRKAHCPVLVARATDYAGLEKTARPDAPYAPGEAPQQQSEQDGVSRVTSTESDGWHPSDSAPTGFRIV